MTGKKHYAHAKVLRLQKAILRNVSDFDAIYLLCAYLQYVCNEQQFESLLTMIEMSDAELKNLVSSL